MWEPLKSAPGTGNLFKNIGFEQLNKDYYIYFIIYMLLMYFLNNSILKDKP